MFESSVKGGKQSSEVTPAWDFLGYRRAIIVLSQVCLIIATYYLAFLLSQHFGLDAASRYAVATSLPILVLIKLGFFYKYGLLSGWWRYVGMSDLVDITKAAVASTWLFYLLSIFVLRISGLSSSAIIIDLLLTILVIGGARFAVRAYTESAYKNYAANKNTLIVGAGAAGSTIVRELKQNPMLDYNPIGFVDDDASKHGIKIHGTKVLGSINDLQTIVEQFSVACVMIAIPSRNASLVERVVNKCRECKVEFKILPPVNQRLHGAATSVRQMRSVGVEDVLGRKPVRLELDEIRKKIENKVALITGAGGSIGSELVRQCATFFPRKLVLLERSENDLFKLCMELNDKFPNLNYVPTVGDILDVGVLREIFALHRPQSVFHAAAYKHVPMMESNCFQAVTNNIFGTYNVAVVSTQYEVEDFVMISSDKAVNPTNIMGVTKRVAELIILGLQRQKTRFMAVRFGNVLGSNGSVLPIFKEQIANGGPVTVTHPEAKRYFMTIPEAVQLVLQASTMGNGGEIFVLDMGEAVNIVDLAQNLIKLSGYEPHREIKIAFTGLRPGEKLFEELQLEGEGIKPTSHEKIRVLDGGEPDFIQVRMWLDDLSALVEAKNVSGLILKLKQIVPEYRPSREILSLCEFDRHDLGWRYKRGSAALAVAKMSDVA
jgi:FlaA1/EpsC-like NDP-sugar epimerase